MTHPTDEELEAMAARLEASAYVRSPAQEIEAAAMLRACKGVNAALEARAEKAEAERDARGSEDVLQNFFDRREAGHQEFDPLVLQAARGYLRTCRVGGMPEKLSKKIEAAIEDMARVGVFANAFAQVKQYWDSPEARAEKAEAERDALRDALAEADDLARAVDALHDSTGLSSLALTQGLTAYREARAALKETD